MNLDTPRTPPPVAVSGKKPSGMEGGPGGSGGVLTDLGRREKDPILKDLQDPYSLTDLGSGERGGLLKDLQDPSHPQQAVGAAREAVSPAKTAESII